MPLSPLSPFTSLAPPSEIAASHRRGVRYLVPVEAVKFLWGAMNTVEEGRRYRKHIIVRQYPRNRKVLQLYTYHFPKTWSAACVANRSYPLPHILAARRYADAPHLLAARRYADTPPHPASLAGFSKIVT